MGMLDRATNLSELKVLYKKLAVLCHPDNGGKVEVMKALNSEYDRIFPMYKARDMGARGTTQTAESTRSEFYTAYGWKGENFNIKLGVKDIAKIIRGYVKEKYPLYKFSITCRDYTKIKVNLMEAPVSIFREGMWLDHHGGITKHTFRASSERSRSEVFNEIGVCLFMDIVRLVDSYNYSDSDAMHDYFNTNFYSDVELGRWDKPFAVVPKTPRVKNTSKADMAKGMEVGRGSGTRIK
jgi:hypothetical protein